MRTYVRRRHGARRASLALVAAVGLVASACGGSEDGTEPASAEDGEAEAADETTTSEDATETGDLADAQAFFASNTVDAVVPYDPGGPYDLVMRAVASELAGELDTNVVPLNEPGAAGLRAANQTWIAEPDGTRVQIAATGSMLLADMGDMDGAEFSMADFSWIGRVDADPTVVTVSTSSPYETLEDLMTSGDGGPVVFSSAGVAQVLSPYILGDAFGVDVEVVRGFSGSVEAWTAVVRGDADAYVRSLSGSLVDVESGEARILAVFDEEAPAEIPDVPSVFDAEGISDEGRALLETHAGLLNTGRTIFGPPGIPDDRVQVLRDALEAVLTDEAFIAEMAERDTPINYLSGEDLEAMVKDITENASETYLELVRLAQQTG